MDRLPDVNAVLEELIEIALVDQATTFGFNVFGPQLLASRVAAPTLTNRSNTNFTVAGVTWSSISFMIAERFSDWKRAAARNRFS